MLEPMVISYNRSFVCIWNNIGIKRTIRAAEFTACFVYILNDIGIKQDFIDDIYFYSELNIDSHELHKTPHGYAIIVPHGFDTRDLFEKWEAYDITLKKDDLLFINILTNK